MSDSLPSDRERTVRPLYVALQLQLHLFPRFRWRWDWLELSFAVEVVRPHESDMYGKSSPLLYYEVIII